MCARTWACLVGALQVVGAVVVLLVVGLLQAAERLDRDTAQALYAIGVAAAVSGNTMITAYCRPRDPAHDHTEEPRR